MSTAHPPSAAPPAVAESVPRAAPVVDPAILPLENGDRLTRDEFERRYENMPGCKKAELIEGVVYMPSPVTHAFHGGPHTDLIIWLGNYRVLTPGLGSSDNATVRLDLDNELQPDALLFVLPSHGGNVRFSVEGYIEGAPELAAEISGSTASYDLHGKLYAYRRNGVKEYVVWRVRDRALDWFVLRGSQYEPIPVSGDGLLKSEFFPGLWLDPAALIAGDLAKVLQHLQQGLASPEHAAFVARLQAAAKPTT